MTPVVLARIQFAFTVAYHFLYVPISMGLALLMVIAEWRHHRTGSAEDRWGADFWIRLLAITFAIGAGTGIVMEFSFGTNWAVYSRFVGDIFGAPLAAEGIFAFFLESTFLAVLLFGRGRVSERAYYASTWIVFLAANLSALWILIANSWMQTPAGFRVQGGRAILTDVLAAAFNPSTLVRFAHTVTSTWLTGAFIATGVAAYYLLRDRHDAFARLWMRTGIWIGVVTSIGMLLLGHLHALEVTQYQPAKLATMEAVYNTGPNQGLYLFGWVDQSTRTVFGPRIPDGLSVLVGFYPSTVVTGLDAFPPADLPPVQIVFQAWHLMVALGFAFIGGALVLWYLERAGVLHRTRWLLWLVVLLTPFPLLSIYAGWGLAEVGRQPWLVYGHLRTAEGVSPVVGAGQIWFTLAVFALFYGGLFLAWARLIAGQLRGGPVPPAR